MSKFLLLVGKGVDQILKHSFLNLKGYKMTYKNAKTRKNTL